MFLYISPRDPPAQPNRHIYPARAGKRFSETVRKSSPDRMGRDMASGARSRTFPRHCLLPKLPTSAVHIQAQVWIKRLLNAVFDCSVRQVAGSRCTAPCAARATAAMAYQSLTRFPKRDFLVQGKTAHRSVLSRVEDDLRLCESVPKSGELPAPC